MANKRDARMQKKREKYKQKREQAQRERRDKAPGKEGSSTVDSAGEWPLGTAWVSSNWYERGARVHVAISRRRADGHLAAGFFEVDLAEQGLVSAKAGADYSENRILGEIGRHSDGEGMIEVDPTLAAKVVGEGRRFGESRGHPLPHGADAALRLIEDIDTTDWPDEILTGVETPPEVKPGLFDAAKRWLFGSPGPRMPAPRPLPVLPGSDADEDDAPTDRLSS